MAWPEMPGGCLQCCKANDVVIIMVGRRPPSGPPGRGPLQLSHLQPICSLSFSLSFPWVPTPLIIRIATSCHLCFGFDLWTTDPIMPENPSPSLYQALPTPLIYIPFPTSQHLFLNCPHRFPPRFLTQPLHLPVPSLLPAVLNVSWLQSPCIAEDVSDFGPPACTSQMHSSPCLVYTVLRIEPRAL